MQFNPFGFFLITLTSNVLKHAIKQKGYLEAADVSLSRDHALLCTVCWSLSQMSGGK